MPPVNNVRMHGVSTGERSGEEERAERDERAHNQQDHYRYE